MTFLDKTFCASPNCKNECGRKMTDDEKNRLYELTWKEPKNHAYLISQAYFCGEPEHEHEQSKT